MFDISFSELALCFVVALVVLGPERLPKVARTLGRWTGQARSYMRNLSAEIERESSVAELRRQFQDAQQAVREAQVDVERSARELSQSVEHNLTPPADAGSRVDVGPGADAAVPHEPSPPKS